MFIVLSGFIIVALFAGTCFLAQYKLNACVYQGLGLEGEINQLKCEAFPDVLCCYGFALGIMVFVVVLGGCRI